MIYFRTDDNGSERTMSNFSTDNNGSERMRTEYILMVGRTRMKIYDTDGFREVYAFACPYLRISKSFNTRCRNLSKFRNFEGRGMVNHGIIYRYDIIKMVGHDSGTQMNAIRRKILPRRNW